MSWQQVASVSHRLKSYNWSLLTTSHRVEVHCGLKHPMEGSHENSNPVLIFVDSGQQILRLSLYYMLKFVRLKKGGEKLHRSMLVKEKYLALIIQTASFIVEICCNCAVVASLILEKVSN